MNEREVIAGLERCLQCLCDDCTLEGASHYPLDCVVQDHFVQEAVRILKEQGAKRPVVHEKNGYWNYVCPTCGSRDEELFYEWNYCPFCGQAVKWE